MNSFNWSDINLVIFDADGTLRRRKDGQEKAPLANDEWEPMPGAQESIDWIKRQNFSVLFGIASNQACVARGEVADFQAMLMLRILWKRLGLGGEVPTSPIQMCPHAPGTCACRKPDPGMLYSIMMFWNIPPWETLFIGDHDTDRMAADRAVCKFMWSKNFLELGKE